MRTLFYTFAIVFICSCGQSQSIEKETIKAFAETRKGVRYDSKLEYQEFVINTITIADSIQILQDKFQKEQSKKLKSVNNTIASLEKRINQKKDITNAMDKAVESSLQKRYARDLEKAQAKKEKIENWKPAYLDRYTASSDLEKSLVKRVDAVFMAQKPRENVPAQYKRSFILSLDGTKCYRMIAHPSMEK